MNGERGLPEKPEKTPREPGTDQKPGHHPDVFRTLRNIFALITAALFIASFFLHGHHMLIRGIGYCTGVLAYFAEVMELTEGFNRKKHVDDLFMALCFGILYILLAVSYIMEHYNQ